MNDQFGAGVRPTMILTEVCQGCGADVEIGACDLIGSRWLCPECSQGAQA
jgi:hypothetical protein